MEKFLIEGGNTLHGTIRIQSAKNACLPILAAIPLIEGRTIIRDVPKISDIDNLLHILAGFGVKIQWKNGDLHLDSTNLVMNEINVETAKKIRGSILVLGSLIGRFGSASLPFPGGCNIGARPIDLHLNGLRDIGINVRERNGMINCIAKRAKSSAVYLDFPSVGATENIILASVRGSRSVKIINAAKEPEIVDLVNFLRKCGACIKGEGTDTVIIQGVKKLGGVDYTPIPDRINTGSYMCAVATVGGDVTLTNVIPEHNYSLIKKLINSGIDITYSTNSIRVVKDINNNKTKLQNSSIQTAPYPGFSTDIQPQLGVFSSLKKGTTIVTENLFENRFKVYEEIAKLGAKVCIKDRKATITGVQRLVGGERENPVVVKANDLRAGVGLVIAGMAASGYTIVERADIVARGHEDIVRDLAAVGASISLICMEK
ncbi:MAG: UDP-N-acetylglucosamine 1-carboxyvinyltransferase [Firmicutes bacterium]|nr:UDP-N-acetylglucosamine 1-carboxyvinyltransferase [Bacillota bacterium]